MDGFAGSPIQAVPYVGMLGALSIATVAFLLERIDFRLPWRWLGIFALGHAALCVWSLIPGAAGSTTGETVRLVLSLATFAALLEFARAGVEHLWQRAPGRWIFVFLVAVGIGGSVAGWRQPGRDVEVWLAGIAVLAAAVVFFGTARRVRSTAGRWMRAAGVLAVLHVLGTGLLQAARLHGMLVSGSPSGGDAAALDPLALVGASCGLGVAASLAGYALGREERLTGRGLGAIRTRLIAGAGIATFFALGIGWALSNAAGGGTLVSWILLAAAAATTLGVHAFALRGLLSTWHALVARAQRTRIENEALLNAVVETSGDGLLVVDSQGNVVASNVVFCELSRIPAEQLEQMDEEALLASFREHLVGPDVFLARARSLRGTLEESIDLLRFKDGRVLRCSSRPLPEGGVLAGRVWSISDITVRTHVERERRERNARLERQSEALMRLAETQSELLRDRDLGLRQIAKVAAEALHVEHVSVWLYSPRGQEIRNASHYMRSSDKHSSAASDSLTEDPAHLAALKNEGVLAVNDVRQDPRTRGIWETYTTSRGIVSLLDAPVRLHGEIVGLISLGHVGPPRRWKMDEQIFVGSMADCVATVIEAEERERVERGLQRALRFHRQVIETAATPFFMTDEEGRIREVNDSFCAATAFFPEEIVGRHFTVLATDRCDADCPLRQSDLGQRIFHHTCSIDDKGGRPLEIVLNASVVEDAAGRLQGRLFSFVDVTQAMEARRETDTILRETEAVRDQARSYRERRQALERELEETRHHLARARLSVEDAREEHDRYRETARQEKAALEAEWRHQREQVSAELLEAHKDLREAKGRARGLEEELREAERQLVDRVRAAQEVVEGARRSESETIGELNDLREALRRAERERDELRRDLDARGAEIGRAQVAADAAMVSLRREMEAKQVQLQTLQEQLDETRTGRESLARQLEDAQDRVAVLDGELTELRGGNESTADEFARMHESIASLEADLARAREQGTAQEAEAAAERDCRTALEDELGELRAQKTSLEDALTIEHERAASLEATLAAGRERAASLESTLATERERAASLEGTLGTERERAASLESTLAIERERAVSLETDLAAERQRRESLAEELAGAADREGGVRAELGAAVDREGGVRAELGAAVERETGLQHELDEVRARHAALAGELQDAQQRIAELGTGRTKEDQRRDEREAALAKMRDELREAEERARESGAQVNAGEVEIVSLREQLGRTEKELDQLRHSSLSHGEQAQQEAERAQKEREAARDRMIAAEQRVGALEHELGEVHERLTTVLREEDLREEEWDRRVQEANEALAASKDALTAAKDELREHEQRAARAEQETVQVQERVAELEQAITDTTTQLEQAQQEAARVAGDAGEQLAAAERKAQDAARAELERVLADGCKREESLKAELEQLRASAEAAQQRVTESEREAEAARQQLVQKAQEAEAAQARAAEIEREAKAAQEKAAADLALVTEAVREKEAAREREVAEKPATGESPAMGDGAQGQTRFMASLSHELRTPLSAIVGMTDLVMGGRLSKEQRAQLETVQGCAQALQVFLEDLLDLARAETGCHESGPTVFDVRAVVAIALQPFAFAASQKGIDLSWSLASEIPDRLEGDAARLRQVLVNLVGNAIKFTEKGKISVRVTVIPESDTHIGLIFSISDTGSGIRADRLQAMLHPPAESEKATGGLGAGLGLAVARQLVPAMGGRFWAESEVGKGSTFHFTMRMRIVQDAAGAGGQAPGRATTGSQDGSAEFSAIDLEELLRRAGGHPEVACEMGEVFLKESPRLLARIRQAILVKNTMALGVAAHLVKGAAANLAAENACQHAARIEKLAREGDLSGAKQELKALEQEVQRVRKALNSLSRAA
ncbi:MAG: PAS domain S-box protein [Candidatus Eisenbacteria sp.]|nr:PAS domain S-box protein [Candidatus Eisenbacteria bacterium]